LNEINLFLNPDHASLFSEIGTSLITEITTYLLSGNKCLIQKHKLEKLNHFIIKFDDKDTNLFRHIETLRKIMLNAASEIRQSTLMRIIQDGLGGHLKLRVDL